MIGGQFRPENWRRRRAGVQTGACRHQPELTMMNLAAIRIGLTCRTVDALCSFFDFSETRFFFKLLVQC